MLLEQPRETWTLARLATEASLSLRTAHLVINALGEKAFVNKRRGAITLTRPGDLLDLWAENYKLEAHRQQTFQVEPGTDSAPSVVIGSNRKLCSTLGWRPRIPLVDSLAAMLAYEKNETRPRFLSL